MYILFILKITIYINKLLYNKYIVYLLYIMISVCILYYVNCFKMNTSDI